MQYAVAVRESCGQTTSDSVALFRSPNYPSMNWEPVNCAFTMVPRQDVCGIRYDDPQLDTTLNQFHPLNPLNNHPNAHVVQKHGHSLTGHVLPAQCSRATPQPLSLLVCSYTNLSVSFMSQWCHLVVLRCITCLMLSCFFSISLYTEHRTHSLYTEHMISNYKTVLFA